jgi:hypothetical protein
MPSEVLNYKQLTIVSNPQLKQLHLFNEVDSMILSIKLAEYLYEITTGENKVGSKQREQWINRVRDRTEMEMAWVGNVLFPLIAKVFNKLC